MNLIQIENVSHLFGEPSKSAIYGILNLVNGKIYIGSAVKFNMRFSSHISKLNKGKHINIYLQKSWIKNSPLAFEFIILEFVSDKNDLIEREQYWIDLLKASDPEFGYNIRKNASNNLGLKYPPYAGEKIRAANLGKVHSAEHKAKNSAANKGHFVSEETKAKIGKANSRPDLWPHEKKYNCNCRECLDKKNIIRALKRYNHEGEFSLE